MTCAIRLARGKLLGVDRHTTRHLDVRASRWVNITGRRVIGPIGREVYRGGSLAICPDEAIARHVCILINAVSNQDGSLKRKWYYQA